MGGYGFKNGDKFWVTLKKNQQLKKISSTYDPWTWGEAVRNFEPIQFLFSHSKGPELKLLHDLTIHFEISMAYYITVSYGPSSLDLGSKNNTAHFDKN